MALRGEAELATALPRCGGSDAGRDSRVASLTVFLHWEVQGRARTGGYGMPSYAKKMGHGHNGYWSSKDHGSESAAL